MLLAGFPAVDSTRNCYIATEYEFIYPDLADFLFRLVLLLAAGSPWWLLSSKPTAAARPAHSIHHTIQQLPTLQ